MKTKSYWEYAFTRLKKDRIAVFSFWIVFAYALIAIFSKFKWVGASWDQTIGVAYSPPSFESVAFLLGTDIFGRSVLYKVLHGTEVAMGVGLVATLIAVPVGVTLGALAGYFGKRIDEGIVWFYTTVSSIPDVLLLVAVAYVMGKGLSSVYVALGATSWIGICRIIRAEFLKHKNREYVLAAQGLGASHGSRIFRHILPNVSHQIIIYFSMLFQSSIKAEVILSFLGIGVQDEPSWGVMISDAKLELLRGVWWQLTGATVAMFFVVLAFNLLGDSLRDALDPKLK